MLGRGLTAAALILALLATLWWGWSQRARAVAAEGRVAAYEEAARVTAAHIRAAEAERDKWRAVADELSTVEGPDEPLNPYERAVLDRVRSP